MDDYIIPRSVRARGDLCEIGRGFDVEKFITLLCAAVKANILRSFASFWLGRRLKIALRSWLRRPFARANCFPALKSSLP